MIISQMCYSSFEQCWSFKPSLCSHIEIHIHNLPEVLNSLVSSLQNSDKCKIEELCISIPKKGEKALIFKMVEWVDSSKILIIPEYFLVQIIRPLVNRTRWHSAKESACQGRRCRRSGFNPWVGKIPLRRRWQPTSVFLAGKSHRQRSLTGYNTQDHKELDMTKAT